MRKALQGIAIGLVSAAALLAPGMAIDSKDIAEVERRAGQVDIRPPALQTDQFNVGWQQVSLTAFVPKEGWTRTYQRAIADCRSLTGGVTCRIGPRTLVSINDFLDSPEEIRCVIWLPEGSIRSKAPRTPGKKRHYEVRTSNAVLSARGTEWTTQYAPLTGTPDTTPDPFDQNFNLKAAPGETRIAVTDGIVDVSLPGDPSISVGVPAGYPAVIDAKNIIHIAPTMPLDAPLTPEQQEHIQQDLQSMELNGTMLKVDGRNVDLSDAGLDATAAQVANPALMADPLGGDTPYTRPTIEKGTFTQAGGGIGDGAFQTGNSGVPLQTLPPQSTCPPPGGGGCMPPCMP